MGIFTQSLFAGLLCFISGVLVDIDHLIDHVANNGLKGFNFKDIYWTGIILPTQREKSKIKKLYLIFHIGEVAILFWASFAFFRNIYLLSISLGYTGHLILDCLPGIMKPQAYFISYRIKNSFRTDRLLNRLFPSRAKS